VEKKRPFGRPRCVRGDNIKTDLGEIDRESVDWIHVVQ
jgi:hypothetical protein